MVEKILRNDTGGIAEIDHPRFRRIAFCGRSDCRHLRDGAQRVHESADAGCLLTDQTETQRDFFVSNTRLQTTRSDLGDDIVRPVQRVREVTGLHNARLYSVFAQESFAKITDNMQARLININKTEFFQRENITAPNKPLHQLRAISTARANDR